jgi:CBS domain containing-hemolysin-like protein
VYVLLGLELRAFTLSYSASPFFCLFVLFCFVFLVLYIFEIVPQAICVGWLQTTILLISCLLSSSDYGCKPLVPLVPVYTLFKAHMKYLSILTVFRTIKQITTKLQELKL